MQPKRINKAYPYSLLHKFLQNFTIKPLTDDNSPPKDASPLAPHICPLLRVNSSLLVHQRPQTPHSSHWKRSCSYHNSADILHSELFFASYFVNATSCCANAGELGTLLLVHGFPEVWYSWRHQMVAAAAAGFRAIAPDLPGYGLSELPADLAQASWEDLTNDLLAILDSLSIAKAFLIAKDFGVKPVFDLALCHPDRVSGVLTFGVPPVVGSLPFSGLPEGFYIFRWREPGRAEADFGRFNVGRVMRTIYILFSRSEIPIAKEGQEIMDLANESTPLPQWFTEEDLSAYTSLYENSGFITVHLYGEVPSSAKLFFWTTKMQHLFSGMASRRTDFMLG